MRCSQCNRWPQLEAADPEVQVDLSDDEITGTVRIVLTCTECRTEIKQAEFDVSIDISEYTKHQCPDENLGVGWDVESEIENSYRQHPPNARRRTTYYGAEGSFKLTCQCGEVDAEFAWSDEVKASEMEEL